jgi:hypothetical protein
MKTKLIIIEGIPGSGKTTTAQFVSECISTNRRTPALYLENARYHPVDIDNLSYFDEHQYKMLLKEFNQYRSDIDLMTEESHHNYLIHYLKWFDLHEEKIPDDFLAYLMKYDAHDTLSPDKYHALFLERWKTFASQSRNENDIVIFECSLFQNPMTVFIGKHNYDISVTKSYILEFAEIVIDLNPILIYLHGESARNTLHRVIDTRPKQWIDLVIEYITGQGYGKAHNLQGLPGVFTFYQLLQDLMEELTSQLNWTKLVIDNSSWEWDRYNQTIATFLNNHM